jgi:glutathione synthase
MRTRKKNSELNIHLSQKSKSRGSARLNLLWITDPWDTLDHEKDTSLRLMDEAHVLGISQSWCSPLDFALLSQPRFFAGKATVFARKVKSITQPRTEESILLSERRAVSFDDFSHVFFRVDPPVNTSFLLSLQILNASIDPKKTEVVNPLNTLSLLSEKLIPFSVPKLTPTTLITTQWEEARNFFKKNQGRILLKPLNGAQSKGIHIPHSEDELHVAFHALVSGGSTDIEKASRAVSGLVYQPCLLQKFHPEIAEGEKRLWFSDGKVLCFGQKLPRKGEFIIQMDQGGSVKPSPLTLKEKKAIPEISKLLRRHHIRWAAVDLIDGLITDFNHTSPGLLHQLEGVWSQNFARPLLENTLGKTF